jgi:hypothetical protein
MSIDIECKYGDVFSYDILIFCLLYQLFAFVKNNCRVSVVLLGLMTLIRRFDSYTRQNI